MAAITGNFLPYNAESIETDASGWGTATNCTLTRTTSSALDGTASLSTKSTAAGVMSAKSAVTLTVPTSAAGGYVSFGTGLVGSASLASTVTLTWLNSSGTSLGTSTASGTASGSWAYIHTGAAVPTGAATVTVTLSATATAANQTVMWDRVWITAQPLWPSNLLPLDTACVEASAAGWSALTNCTLAVSTPGIWFGAFGSSLAITCTAAGDTQARTSAAFTVTAGTEYIATAWLLAAAAVSDYRVEIWWYDASSTFLSSSSKSSSIAASTWTRGTVIANAPTGATTARMVLRPQAGAAGQVVYADQMGLAPTVAGGYVETGNLLGYNAQSIEMDTTGWAAVSGCTIARSSAYFWNGTYSLAITATGSGDAAVQLAAPVPVSVGQAYQFTPNFLWPGTPSNHNVRLDWLDASGDVMRSLTNNWDDSSLSGPGIWGTGSTADLCPVGATHLQCTFIIPAPTTGTVWYLDQALVGPGGLAAIATELPGEYAAQISIQGLTTAGNTQYSLYRMTADGTLTPVRGTAGDMLDLTISGALAVAVDYEAPLDVPVQWYVITSGGPGDGTETYTTTALTLTAPPRNTMVVKDPLLPARSGVFEVSAPADWTRPASAATFWPRGASAPIIRFDVRRSRTGTLTVLTETDADRQQLEWLLASGDTLLMQAPTATGWDDIYVQVADAAEPRSVPLAADTCRLWSLPLTEVARPAGGVTGSAGRTWQDVLNDYDTWFDVYQAYSTWAGVLTGVEGT